MKRSIVFLLACLALGSMPAHADQTVTGTVRAGVLSPTPARLAYNASTSNNGTVGYVFALPPGSDGKRYTLKRTSGPTGLEDLDVYFYTTLTSDTGSCDTGQDLNDRGDTETGSICPHPAQHGAWAIVVIKAGANTTFSFSVSP